LNSSVGLEFLVAYSTTLQTDNVDKANTIGFAIGLQIHLEKEKK